MLQVQIEWLLGEELALQTQLFKMSLSRPLQLKHLYSVLHV